MLSAGIVDPAKVVRVALQDAASIAGLMITTEAMVAETPKKKEAPAMPAAVWAAWTIDQLGSRTPGPPPCGPEATTRPAQANASEMTLIGVRRRHVTSPHSRRHASSRPSSSMPLAPEVFVAGPTITHMQKSQILKIPRIWRKSCWSRFLATLSASAPRRGDVPRFLQSRTARRLVRRRKCHVGR